MYQLLLYKRRLVIPPFSNFTCTSLRSTLRLVSQVSQVGADGGEDDGEKEEAVEKGDGGVEHQHSALLLLPVLHRALVVVVLVVVVGEQTKPIHVGLGGCQSRLIGKESWAFKSSKRKWRPIEQII